MIDCNQARELMNGYIDGVLTEAESLAFEEHISCCENCHEEYDVLHRIATSLAKTSAPLPEGFADRVHCALVEEKLASDKKRKSTFKYYRMASGIAAALVIAAVGKYGVYDVYKKVSDERIHTPAQVVTETPPAEQPSLNDVPPQPEDKAIETPETKKTETPVAKPVSPAPEIVAPEVAAPEIVIPEEPVIIAEGITMDMAVSDERPVMASAVVESRTTDAVYGGAAVVYDDEEPANGASFEPQAPESAVVITEPIPAVIELTGNDEETIMLVKDFLLSLIDESAIVQEENTIKVTVSAEYYDVIVRCVGEIKYIKSVSHGVPFDGVGIIIIR